MAERRGSEFLKAGGATIQEENSHKISFGYGIYARKGGSELIYES